MLKAFSLSFLAVCAVSAGLLLQTAPAGAQDNGWDSIPREYREFQRQGFRDGLQGAQRDFGNHRRPDVNNREEFRSPRVPPAMVNDYRDGFRRGYDAGVRHFFPGGASGVMPWEQRPSSRWDDMPSDFSEFRRNGFREGLAAAQRDYDNQRRPDPEQHEQFRHPAVPYQFAEDFREGFRRGYDVSTRHLYPSGLPALFPGEIPPSPWLTMDHNTVQTQRTAFVEGVFAAGQDYEAGYASDLNRHEEYRSPKMNFLLKVVYKTGYKTGYDTAMRNLADGVPGVASPSQRRAFLDGVAAAHRDFDEKRRPELNLHPEFTQPQVEPRSQDEYRESFRRGFEMANSYLY
jgi:hypothetical protein